MGKSAAPDARGHANLDLVSRSTKARKIQVLLSLYDIPMPSRMLEVGTGSGAIAHYFATYPELDLDVHTIDVLDNRQTSEGYAFELVEGSKIPHADETFELVITNHVIEHVGGEREQEEHLREIFRVLKEKGIVYLAVPNRWQWIEPHYKLAGLSWLPQSLRTPYLKLRGKGDFYDCRPLSVGQIEAMLQRAGFCYEHLHAKAIQALYEIEFPNSLLYRYLLRHLPQWIFRMTRRLLPTLIYVLRKNESL